MPLNIPEPLPGETGDDYIVRVHFERDSDSMWADRWWCLDCGALVRGPAADGC
jgi:hypothetical protein